MNLEKLGVHVTRMIRRNIIGIPKVLKEKKMLNYLQGDSLWQMYNFRKICVVTWVDKKPVIVESTHTRPIPTEGERIVVPR